MPPTPETGNQPNNDRPLESGQSQVTIAQVTDDNQTPEETRSQGQCILNDS